MAVDKSYGSGKSRSAANSSARRRVAAGQMTKSKKSPAEKIKAGRAKMAASPLGQLADTVLGFALPVGKVKAASMALKAAGKTDQAAGLLARAAAKIKGQKIGREFSYFDEPVDLARESRVRSEGVFPRAPKSAPVNKSTMARIAKKGFNKSEIDEFTDFANKYYDEQARLRAKFGKNK